MVQSLSPEETSRWCNSLGPCGIRGELLLALQSSIRQRGVDGLQFQELLRTNTLQNLHIDGLNPRLGVAIRRAWNKDFEHVTLIPHAPSKPPGGSLAREAPPPYAQRIRSAERRAAENGPHVTAEAYAASNIALRLKETPATFDQELAKEVPPEAPAPTSYAPPEPLAKPPRSRRATPNNSDAGGASLADVFAPKAAAPRTFASNSVGTTPQSSRQNRNVDDGWSGISLGDALSSATKVVDQQASAQLPETKTGVSSSSRGSAPRGRRRQTEESCWEGVSLGDALGAKPKARHNFVKDETKMVPDAGHKRDSPPSLASRNENLGWDGTSLADALQPPERAAPSGFDSTVGQEPSSSRSSNRVQRQQASTDPWAGVSLGDALGGPKPSQAHQATAVPHSSIEPRSHGSGGQNSKPPLAPDPWAGVSLGDALGTPKHAVEPREPEPRSRERPGAKSKAQASSGGEVCGKSPKEILEWLKAIPPSLVPEQACEQIMAVVEEQSMDGTSFSNYVHSVPPDICGPKHAMKLKTAWKNVLAESEARAICKANLDYAAAHSQQKAVALSC